MIKRILQIILIQCVPFILFAQNSSKKMLGHEELVTWKRINNTQISNDGNCVIYQLKGEEGDGVLRVYTAEKEVSAIIARGENAKISADSRFVVFKIKPHKDSLRLMKLDKVKKTDLPKDSLGIFDVQTGKTERIPMVKSFKIPKEWAGYVVYQKEAEEITTNIKVKKDTAAVKGAKRKKVKQPKKESGANGAKLVIRNLSTGAETIFPYVVNYELAEKGQKILFQTTGNDSTFLNGLYLHELAKETTQPLFRGEGDYKRMVMDELGNQVAFLANFDTTNAEIAPFELAYWRNGKDSATIIANNSATFLPKDWIINEHETPDFSKNGQQLFFGMSPKPILEDSTLLEEEMVKVEVWHWNDAQLHPQQKVRQKREEKRAYKVVWHPNSGRFVKLGALDMPEIQTGDEGNATKALGHNSKPYEKVTSWEGGPAGKDIYIIDTKTGQKELVAKGIKGSPRLSPKAKFAYAYLSADSAWYAYDLTTKKTVQLTNNDQHPFYDELNDRPMHPFHYSIAGWTENDQFILINDRYDIWKIDPKGIAPAVNLTNGRAKKWRYRYIRLDRDSRAINANEKAILHVFDENTKESGYSYLDIKTGTTTNILIGGFDYTRRLYKAKNANKILFRKGNYTTFSDLFYTDDTFNNAKQISIANPQQTEYAWGTMELVEWTSLDGQKLQGLLAKPENFDPTKKYPMIVNFYERNSHGLYRHRPPSAGRSTINYPFYTSRGYLIFNPDIPYEVGYPGKSCYNAVVSGTQALIRKGFVDESNIGVQGHSWGGYQIAHLLNKTNLFKCAESGAPVVNMFSAYGGIRWGSGMSRMFQYEHTQSRIGGTIWEYRDRYIENSPIFELYKTNTPVLILHNDKDSAVPWYQGIEYFVALRRLGKPAWLLNYNGEPHWPVKLPNRKDFNIRMQQYFDHYLKGAPMPKWMKDGVSAMEKGKLQGLELIKK